MHYLTTELQASRLFLSLASSLVNICWTSIKNTYPNMNNAEEIEYLGFVPISFIKEIQDEIHKKAKAELQECSFKGIPNLKQNKKHAMDIISLSLSKNFFFFQNFAVKAIFSFPKSFSFERKITDLRCEAKIQKLVDEFLQIVEEEKYLRSETLRLEGEIETERFKCAQYRSLLKHEEDMSNAIQSIEELQMLSNEAEKLCQVLMEKQLLQNDDEREIIEFKSLRNEMYKKERDSLYSKASVESLMFYIKNIVS